METTKATLQRILDQMMQEQAPDQQSKRAFLVGKGLHATAAARILNTGWCSPRALRAITAGSSRKAEHRDAWDQAVKVRSLRKTLSSDRLFSMSFDELDQLRKIEGFDWDVIADVLFDDRETPASRFTDVNVTELVNGAIETSLKQSGEQAAFLQAMALAHSIASRIDGAGAVAQTGILAAFNRALDLATLLDELHSVSWLASSLRYFITQHGGEYATHLSYEAQAARLRLGARVPKKTKVQVAGVYHQSLPLWRHSRFTAQAASQFPCAGRSGLSTHFNRIEAMMEAGLLISEHHDHYKELKDDVARVESLPSVRAWIDSRRYGLPCPFKARQRASLCIYQGLDNGGVRGCDFDRAIELVAEPLLVHAKTAYLSAWEIRDLYIVLAEAVILLRRSLSVKMPDLVAPHHAGAVDVSAETFKTAVQNIAKSASQREVARGDDYYRTLSGSIRLLNGCFKDKGRRHARFARLRALERAAAV